MPGKHPPASTEEGISLILQAENDAQHREIKEKRIFDWKKHISEEAETLLQLIPFALGSEVADRSCHRWRAHGALGKPAFDGEIPDVTKKRIEG